MFKRDAYFLKNSLKWKTWLLGEHTNWVFEKLFYVDDFLPVSYEHALINLGAFLNLFKHLLSCVQVLFYTVEFQQWTQILTYPSNQVGERQNKFKNNNILTEHVNYFYYWK